MTFFFLMVNIVKKRLIDCVYSYDVVLVGMGLNNAFSRGFPSYISACFPEVKKIENEESPYGDRRKYGTILPIKHDGITFCMCYVHSGGYRKNGGKFIDTENLKKCLSAVVRKFKGKRIASPLIGTSPFDGGAPAEDIMGIYDTAFSDIDIDVYLYNDTTLNDEVYREFSALRRRYHDKEISKEEFSEGRNRLFWIRDNGIFKEMPEKYEHKTGFEQDGVISVKKSDLEKE